VELKKVEIKKKLKKPYKKIVIKRMRTEPDK
jgi:hypothetical protein